MIYFLVGHLLVPHFLSQDFGAEPQLLPRLCNKTKNIKFFMLGTNNTGDSFSCITQFMDYDRLHSFAKTPVGIFSIFICPRKCYRYR